MGMIDAYIPMERRFAIANAEELPDRTFGAVLFADISGFTLFGHALYQELGPTLSAEELTHQLNNVYGSLIGTVHRYGGSVINFGGDAITCWFDKDNGRRATACALDMQKVMYQIENLSTPTGEQYPIGIKVAVTSGRARRFLVGQPRIQRIEVLAGEILDRMAAAERQLQSGEVVVGSEVMGRFGNQAIIEEWREDESGEHFALLAGLTEPVSERPWSETAELELEPAREWLLPPVYERLLRGEGDYLAELRTAVAIFLRFSGINYDDDDDAGAKLDTYICWVQRVLSRYEGFLVQLNIGDKGSYLFCAFGARMTHEDDVDRALSAAMELMFPPHNLIYIKEIQIGITRGQVRVGAYGAPSRRTYGVQGNDVNFAAKLMSEAAPGQILTSKRIMEEASRQYEFEELDPISLIGLDEPFPVFLLTSELPRMATAILGRSRSPIIGREAEQTVLNEGLQALLEGRSATIILEGDAGIGKSRLVEYILQQASRSGVTMLVGGGDEVGKSSMYFAWRPVYRQLFKLDHNSRKGDKISRAEKRAHILDKLRELTPHLVHLAPLLNSILPVEIPENELTSQMTGEVRADNIRVLLVELLSQQAKSNYLLLVLEDAHWMDSASMTMVPMVYREVNPLMIVMAQRPPVDQSPETYVEMQEGIRVSRMQLDPFSTAEVQALACQRLEVQELPQQVLEFVHERAEGNPFFSEELVYALCDAGVIKIVDGKCQITTDLSNLFELEFPDTIQDVIRSRIDRLAPQEQLTLKVASVIGRIFAYRILYDIHPVEADKLYLNDDLDALDHLALIELESPEPDLVYKFKHIFTREVAYNLMLFALRRKLHCAIAEWYENTYAEDLTQVYALLAYHWEKTDNGKKAVEFLEKAGEQAVRNFANREAVMFLQMASTRMEKDDLEVEQARRAQWELLLGEAYVNLAEHLEGRQHLEAGLTLLEQSVPRGHVRLVVEVFGQVMRQVVHRMWPSQFIGRQGKRRVELLAASRACERLVEVYYITNDTLLSLYTAFRTLNLAEAAGSSPELARGYATVGALVGFIPLHSMATAYLRRALEAVEELEDLNARAWVSVVAAFYYAGVGNWEEATLLQKTAVKISRQLGDLRREEDGIGNLFALNYLQGNFNTSMEYIDELIYITRDRNSELSLAYGLQGKAYVSLHLSLYDEAMICLEELHSLLTEDSTITDEALSLEMYGLLAMTHLRRAEFTLALEMVEKATLLTQSLLPSNFSSFSGYTGPACVYLTLWEAGYSLPNVRKLAWRACKMLRKYARVFPIGEPRAFLYEGWYHWLLGKRARAQNYWKRGLTRAVELGMHYDQGLIHYQIGRHLPFGDHNRKIQLNQAVEIFTQIGAKFDLEQSEATLLTV
jgi:predicted ATPase/class 3 adenylate cyclase